MVDIMSGFASAMTAIEIAKNVKTAIDKVADAETKIQMADLISTLADVKMELAERAGYIAELEQLLVIKEQMEYVEPNYWQMKKDGSKDGPFCQKCYDSDQKTIRLQVLDPNQQWNCLACSSSYFAPGYSSGMPGYLDALGDDAGRR